MSGIAELRAAFPERPTGYLDTPTMGLPPAASTARLREQLALCEAGEAEHPRWERDRDACRDRFAELLGVSPDDVGLTGSVAPPAAAVARTLARGGAEFVAHPLEFRSLLLPFLAEFGSERARWVDGEYRAQAFLERIDGHVRAVIVSAVSSAGGDRPDLVALADACARVDAELIVDASQALGPVGLGLEPHRTGAVLAAGYKGLLAPRGAAYAYVRPGLLDGAPVVPSPAGMADDAAAESYGPPLDPRPGARGLDGSPAWLSWVGALPGLELLAGVAEPVRERHVLGLAERLRRGLAELGATPAHGDRPSPIVTVAVERAREAVAGLRERGVRAAARRGRIRFGLHVYNDEADVERALEAFAAVRPVGSHHPRPLLNTP